MIIKLVWWSFLAFLFWELPTAIKMWLIIAPLELGVLFVLVLIPFAIFGRLSI